MSVTADRRHGLALLNVSRETEAILQKLVDLVLAWQKVKNLIGRSTLDEIWTRHVADSAQLIAHTPEDARVWVDLGSGAGFPGLVVAILLRDRPGFQMHLVESDGRKAAFLRTAARETGAPAVIHNARIADALPIIGGPVDVVSARALASLPELLDMSADLLKQGAIGLFLKGQDVASELTDDTTYSIVLKPSVTDAKSSVVIVRSRKTDHDHAE